MEGFLLAPGYIDLSDLRFWAVEEVELGLDDDHFPSHDDEKGDDEEESSIEFDDDGGVRQLEEPNDFMVEGSSVDIAVFRLVSFVYITWWIEMQLFHPTNISTIAVNTVNSHQSVPPLKRDVIGLNWVLESVQRKELFATVVVMMHFPRVYVKAPNMVD